MPCKPSTRPNCWLNWANNLATLQAWLRRSQQALADAGSTTPSIDARWLLAAALGKPDSYLYTWPEQQLCQAVRQQADGWLARRLKGEPVAYILGQQEFYGRPFKVTPATLIPRPDTEHLVETVLAWLPSGPQRVLELGTGTGAIALTLALERPQWQVVAVDNSAAALAVAQHNQQQLRASNCTLLLSDWFAEVAGRFDAVVSNPPYIDAADAHLQQGDVRFEPSIALVAGNQGLADIQWIASQAPHFLHPSGLLVFEHGYQQGQAVAALLGAEGWRDVATVKDYGGQDRVTHGVWAG